MDKEYIKISDLNNYIKNILDDNIFLNKVYLKGEISNFKNHTRGHLYFTLKDDTSRLSAVMFQSSAVKLTFTPEDGMNVLVEGRISAYPAQGSYQIYIEKMEPDGLGALYIEYEKLKKKLALEGLFDAMHKKAIPKFPEKIGVITASTGAAVRDIMSTIKRRYPVCEAILFPCLVQGKDAAPDIVRQIKRADEFGVDTIIVGRGGGSIEDLWAFNEEIVAHAIYECKTPIISAVGHEIDWTIADFVADLRAPTPSAAAELANPNVADLISDIEKYNNRLKKSLITKIETMKLRYEKCMASRVFKEPLQKINERYILIDMKVKKMQNLINSKVKDDKTKMVEVIAKLDTLSPLKTLARGYSLTTGIDGKIIKSANNIKKDDELVIRFKDGKTNVKVI